VDNNKPNGINPLDGRFFYVAHLRTGKLVQGCEESPDEFFRKRGKMRLAWLDYKVADFKAEATGVAKKFGFKESLIKELLKGRDSGYEDLNDELGILMPAITVKGLEVQVNPVIILIKDSLVLTIHGGEIHRFTRFRRYAESYLKKVLHRKLGKDRLSLLLARIIDENNNSNFDHLREIEDQGDEMSKMMLDLKAPRAKLGVEIYKMKHALITYLNALWDTLDVVNSLRYGDAELLTDDPKLLQSFDLLATEINQQISLSEHMSEVLASGLEVLQSIYNNQLQMLNNRMAFAMTYLTILGTAVLVPNTIATVMASTAFEMGPEDKGWYLALIVGSTVLSVVFTYWWIHSQKWFKEATRE